MKQKISTVGKIEKKLDPYIQLYEIQIGSNIMKTGMKVSQKIKNKIMP